MEKMTKAPASQIRMMRRIATSRSESTNHNGRAAVRKSTLIIVSAFIISLTIPIIFYIGPMRLSPYRLLLVLLFVPCFLSWISGSADRIHFADILILFSALWGAIALSVNARFEEAIEPAGILLIETFGSYLLARTLIRGQEDFEFMVRMFFWTVLFLTPFAMFEAITGRPIILEAIRSVFPVIGNSNIGTRMGLYRAQVLFEHPILYGSFCASGFGLAYYVIAYKKSSLGKLGPTLAVTLAAFLSVSAGALASVVVQVLVLLWDKVTRAIINRWRLFGILSVCAYFLVDLISNRSPFHVFVTYLTFNTGSAYNRILIWDHGSAEVLRHPLFGIGFNDWVRPYWMSSSMDNFWLVVAVRYGLPSLLGLAIGIILIMRSIGRAKLQSEQFDSYRTGLIIALVGMIVAGCTVHYWNALYSWFMFLVGSGVWMLEHERKLDQVNSPDGKAANPRRGPKSKRIDTSPTETETRRPINRPHPRTR